MEFVIVLILVGGSLLAVTLWNRRKIQRMRAWNFDWYRKEFPNLVSGGRVRCYRCNGSELHVERLMERTYLRRHSCRQCGTALYYSPEN